MGNVDRLGEYTVHPTIHLPECPISRSCPNADDHELFIGYVLMFCIHCTRECLCDALRACEKRVIANLRHEKTPPHRIIPGQGG